MKKGITVIGMAGAGKSGVGRILARMLGWRFVDLDALILETQGIIHHDLHRWSQKGYCATVLKIAFCYQGQLLL